jgi:hypothetical protein
MSVAKLKEEGNKALHKKDYEAALKFFNVVCYCAIRAPEVHFFSPNIVVHLCSLRWLASLSDALWVLV